MSKISEIQSIIGVAPDGIWGPKSQAALEAVIRPPVQPSADSGAVLRGDGSFPWTAEIEGDDIVVRGARATCFGGANDPQDSGDTASGISTKKNPDIKAVSLPMDYRGSNGPTRKALSGSPIPMVPWKTLVRVTRGEVSADLPVIDLGPAKRTGNALDLTIAAARLFNPEASATNFEMRCEYRILGGAKYAKA